MAGIKNGTIDQRLRHTKITLSQADDRIRGILFGLAAGDKNGGPIQMALCLSESLVQQGKFDPADVLKRYLQWWNQSGFDTGPVAAHVLTLISQGIPYQEATRQVHNALNGQTAGCNPAHRISPIAMAAFVEDDALMEIAHQESALTHWDILAGDVAASVAMLCRNLIRGVDWFQAIEQLLPKSIYETLLQNPTQLLNLGGFAPDVFHTAIYFVNKYSTFEEALTESIKYAGLANYCPVLVGAFAGARWGRTSIPDSSLSHCMHLEHNLIQTAESLLQTWK